jgi:ribose 1,5-bisphosphokinase
MTAGHSRKIGPGTLVSIVGPSGAGKDTLISLAAEACRNDRGIVFPRRIVTRPSSDVEDHDSVTAAGFDEALTRGHLAFWWEAHGHRYGIPKAINSDIQAGHVVVCNVSRAIVPKLATIYQNLLTVLVTAPDSVLERRLRNRGRSTDHSVAQRLARNMEFRGLVVDVVIENTATPHRAAELLQQQLRRPRLEPARPPR